MERIENYVNQSGFYGQAVQAERGGAGEKAAAADAAREKREPAPLSQAARKLLKELKKSYGDMDFIVADYKTKEEAASYLARGTSEYSTLLTPEELEKMAADGNYKKEALQKLDKAVNKLDEMKEKLGDKGNDISRMGVAIGKDGEVSFFAELEKVSEKQRERIERQREADREAGKTDSGRMPNGRFSGKRTTVFASSVDELAEKISRVDWNSIKEEPFSPSGQRFDFTI